MSLRQQFPYFQHNTLVYLDSAATTQKPACVIEAVHGFYQNQNATVHRSAFKDANKVTNQYESAREKVASFIKAPSPQQIIWTKGTTESINLVALSWGQQHINQNDLIVVLGSEHHANFVPWQQLAKLKNARFEVVNVLPDGGIDQPHFDQLMSQGPKLVALQHCSNALGNIYPVAELMTQAKRAGAVTLIDGAQAVAHLKVDVSSIDCDFYAFSGHKLYGPTGIGVLYIHPRMTEHMSPVFFGGEMIQDVTIEQTSFRPFPHFLETGTPNIAGVIGLSAAISFIQSDTYLSAQSEVKSHYHYLISELSNLPEVICYGQLDNNVGIVSFNVDGESAGDVGALLSEQNVAVRVGHHCAMPLMKALGLSGTVRVSLACYNNQDDIDSFIDALKKSIQLLAI